MSAAAEAMPAFLGDAAIKAHWLDRARGILAHNTVMVAPAAGSDTVSTTTSTRRAGAPVGATPSAAALEAALAAGSPAVGRPTTGPAPAGPSGASGGMPRRLWLPEEAEDPDFFGQRLGFPGALAELLQEFPLAMPPARMPGFALECLQAIAPGADLRAVAPAFVAWLFDDPSAGALRFSLSPVVRAAAQAVARLHAEEAGGRMAPRTEWAASRRAAQALAADAGSDPDRAVAVFAGEAAWSCANSRSVASQSLRVWQFGLGSLPAQQALGFSHADREAHGRLLDAFWAETAELRQSMQAAGQPRETYEAAFANRHPEIARRHDAFAARAKADRAQLILAAGDHWLRLLRDAPPA